MSASARLALGAFAQGHTASVIAPPSQVVRLDDRSVLDALYQRLGGVFLSALNPTEQVASPVAGSTNGAWLASTHCVGINLCTVGDLLQAVKYVLSLPAHVNSIHLLPVFEPGVVGSLYGMASWRLNEQFFSASWARIVPELRHVNDQLRSFVDLCHALGKTVGLDVIPHTDRFSEIALCNPWMFEWVRRNDATLLDHRADLHLTVEEYIAGYARGRLDADFARAFFARPEATIAYDLFGDGDAFSRNQRRDKLIAYLYRQGFETLPATMAPPYRGLELDPRPQAVTVDEAGRSWREFRFTHPQAMSRVFGPLTRYKLYDRLDDNRAWQVDFDTPRPGVWQYVAKQYAALVQQYGFDFMRGDMSHVQMRADGVPAEANDYYDLLGYVKAACAKTHPHFAYFAESFLTADDYMTYGSEVAHLDLSGADVALGNLQNYAPHDEAFLEVLAEYEGFRQNQSVAPCFCYFSADKDDPRFDRCFNEGSLARYFFAVFCPRFPAYGSLGFRERDVHDSAWPNEHYTKLYVFDYDEGPKATQGPYRWGTNQQLHQDLERLDGFRESLANDLFSPLAFRWLVPPGTDSDTAIVAWAVGPYRFVVNFGRTPTAFTPPEPNAELVFATHPQSNTTVLSGGAARVYALNPTT